MRFIQEGITNEVIPYIENGLHAVDKVDIYSINSKAGEFNTFFNLYKCEEYIRCITEKMHSMANKLDVSIEIYKKAEHDNSQIVEQLFMSEIGYNDFIYVDEEGRYGVAQNILDRAVEDYSDPQTIREVAEVCNMSFRTAAQYCMYIDSLGACSYASSANVIAEVYKDDPIQFKKDFGYPLYKVSSDGTVVVNSELLIADLFLYYNIDENGGKFFTKDVAGKVIMNEDIFLKKGSRSVSTDPNEERTFNLDQVNMGEFTSEDTKISEIMEAKGTSKKIETKDYFSLNNCSEDNKEEDIKNYIQKQAKDESNLIVMTYGIFKNTIKVTNITTDEKRKVSGAGHAAYLLDTDDKGVYYSTDGDIYFVSYEDLAKCEYCEFQTYQEGD